MACNQYNVNFSIDEVITFVDCSGDTQTLSGKASTQYFVCSQTPPTIPALGVTSTDLGPATLYFFSSCCGNYFFNACVQDSSPPGSYLTVGSQYIQFNDGLTTTNKCFFYDSSVVPPVGVDIPLAVVIQRTGVYQSPSLDCNNCEGAIPGEQCDPYYFRYCCCDYSTPTPPMYCYFSIIGKTLSITPNLIYYVTLTGGTTFCAESVDSSLINFYSIDEYNYDDDISSLVVGLDTENCTDCTQNYPCSIPITSTPTPTPTRTPVPSPIPRTRNECEPIDIYNMEISCVVLQPSNFESNDGAASLNISGGTPPYTIIWDNGNISPAIGNLSVGEYGATVVDFYKDFTAKTVCILTGQTITPTPTPTPTQSPIPQGPVFCFFHRSLYGPEQYFLINDTFSVDSYLNGQPSWISGDGHYRIYWNNMSIPQQWEVSGDTPTPVLLCNSNQPPPAIPTNQNDWQVIGGALLFNTITLGPCIVQLYMLNPLQIESPTMTLYTVKTDPICGCDGSIVADAEEGIPPYQYSIDNGLTYKNFPIFDSLCSGNYSVTVKDSLDFTKTSFIELNKPTDPTTYVVSLSKNSNTIVDNGTTFAKTYNVTLNISPPLPDYATISFDINHVNVFKTSTSPNSAQLTNATALFINEVENSASYILQSTGTTVNTKNGCQDQTVFISGNTLVWKNLTLNSLDTLTINTSTSIQKNFTTACDFATADDNFTISNLTIAGCTCCTVQNTAL